MNGRGTRGKSLERLWEARDGDEFQNYEYTCKMT